MIQANGAGRQPAPVNSVRVTDAKMTPASRPGDDKKHSAPPTRGQAHFVSSALGTWLAERSVEVMDPSVAQPRAAKRITELRGPAPIAADDAPRVFAPPPLLLTTCPLARRDAPAAREIAESIAQASEEAAGRPLSPATLQRLSAQVLQAVCETRSNLAWLFGTLVSEAGGAALSKAQLAPILHRVMDPASGLGRAHIKQAVQSICAAFGNALPTPVLEAVVECTRATVSQRDGFEAQCAHAYDALSAMIDMPQGHADERLRLKSLLDAVVGLQESFQDWPVMFASWFALAQQRLGASEVIAFTLAGVKNMAACSPAVVMYLAGRIAAHDAQALRDQPEKVPTHHGHLINQLIRLDPDRAAAGLSGAGQTLHDSPHFGQRHRCELLQAIASLKDVIRDNGAAEAIRRFVNELGGEAGFRRAEATAIVESLHEQSHAGDPEQAGRDATQTIVGLFRGTLAPGMTHAEVTQRLPDLGQVLRLGSLSNSAVQDIGRALVETLGGKAIDAAVLQQLVQACPHDLAGGRSGALLRGIVHGAGASAIDDARLAAIGRALSAMALTQGAALTVHLAAGVGAVGAQRDAALRTLRSRLEGLQAAPDEPQAGGADTPATHLPAALHIGLGLSGNPAAALAPTAIPSAVSLTPAEQLALFDEAISVPDLLDDATLERQLWGCGIWAARDFDTALQAVARLPDAAIARLKLDAFGPLRTALLAQALKQAPGGVLTPAGADALTAVYRRFVEHARLDESAAPTAGRSNAPRSVGADRAAALARRTAAQQAFLKQEIALVSRGIEQDAMEPLLRKLRALSAQLPQAKEGKR